MDGAFCVGADNVMRNRPQEFHKWLARLSGIDADNHINVFDGKDLKRASSIKVCGEVVCGMGVVERMCHCKPRPSSLVSTSDGQWRFVAIASTVQPPAWSDYDRPLGMIVSFLFWADRALTREIFSLFGHASRGGASVRERVPQGVPLATPQCVSPISALRGWPLICCPSQSRHLATSASLAMVVS